MIYWHHPHLGKHIAGNLIEVRQTVTITGVYVGKKFVSIGSPLPLVKGDLLRININPEKL